MALLRYAAKFDPFLSLDCAPHALHPGAIQGKEGIKFCHLATLIRSWKTMPPRVKAAVIERERRSESEQLSSLSPDLLRRTYPAVKSIESEAGSVADARLQGSLVKSSLNSIILTMHLSILNLFTERTNNTEDIPGEIVGGSTLEKLIEFGMREEATRFEHMIHITPSFKSNVS